MERLTFERNTSFVHFDYDDYRYYNYYLFSTTDAVTTCTCVRKSGIIIGFRGLVVWWTAQGGLFQPADRDDTIRAANDTSSMDHY